MGGGCCVPYCHNARGKNKNLNTKLSFFTFPKGAALRKQWIVAVRRDEGKFFKIVENSTCVCSNHFKPDDIIKGLGGKRRLKAHAVPELFLWTKFQPKQRSREQETSASASSEVPLSSCQESVANPGFLDHSYAVHLPAVEKLKLAKKYIKELEEQNKRLFMGKFSAKRFAHDDEIIQFYTGFPSFLHLETTYRNLQPTALIMNKLMQALQPSGAVVNQEMFQCEQLSIFDQFFMFLCFVRQGLPELDLSVKFAVSESVVHRTLTTWADYLHFVLSSIPIWIEKSKINEMMPQCFTETFPGTRVILHCTELKGQICSSKVVNSWMYSNGTSTKTRKGLIGFAPHGTITFVSKLFPGLVSDADITARSGLLDLLEPMDNVMVDKEFKIEVLQQFTSRGCRLIMPPFLTRLEKEPSEEDAELTQRVTRMCLHAERAISRVKVYGLFEKPIPLHVLSSVDQLWTVCVLLTNFHGPLKPIQEDLRY